ncbi:MAG: cupredoxin family copper-binding protein [Candidatus Woesearchaeota archaeon]|nr:cupredoxin family copper-binding protein [Candidatus Woesearchaeota archaeon]
MKLNSYKEAAILIIIAAIIVPILGCQSDQKDTGSSSGTQANTVDIKNFAFNPSEIKIKQGETVEWINKDTFAKHTVTSDSGDEIISETFSNGQAYLHTFNEKGTFEYHCSIHPTMKGKITAE